LELSYFGASNLTAVIGSAFCDGKDTQRKRTSVPNNLCEENLAIFLLNYS
jgi:hypothetical protein